MSRKVIVHISDYQLALSTQTYLRAIYQMFLPISSPLQIFTRVVYSLHVSKDTSAIPIARRKTYQIPQEA